MEEAIVEFILVPIKMLIILVLCAPIWIPLVIIGVLLYHNYKNMGKNVLKVVTHYCPNCGLLVSDKENKIHYCVLCGTAMKEGREKDGYAIRYPGKRGNEELYVNNIELYVNRWSKWPAAYRRKDYDLILNYAEEHPENMVAQYCSTWCYDEKDERRIAKLEKLADQGYAEAACDLGMNYYEGTVIEKNYVLAQKYFEKAAQAGHGFAYVLLAAGSAAGEFRWSNMVKSEEDGFFKAAVRRSALAQIRICERYNGNRKGVQNSRIKDNIPLADESKLWWLVCAAGEGDAEAVPQIRVCCTRLMKILSAYKKNPEANALYAEYEQIMNYWNDKELELQYPNPICYEAVIAEQNNEIEKALNLYKRAAEEDNDEKAIEAVRRLTGNKNYKLKTGRLQAEDYRQAFNKAKSLLQNGEYDLCLIQARRVLEIYVHNLFFEKKVDMPAGDDLNNLIKELQRLQLVDEKTYNAMDFVRRKGNNAVHGTDNADEDTANRVMDALLNVIKNSYN